MNVFPFEVILLTLASSSSSPEADWLWQFVEVKKDGPHMRRQMLRGAKEIARLLHGARGEGEGEGDAGDVDNTTSALPTDTSPMPLIAQPTPSTSAPADALCEDDASFTVLGETCASVGHIMEGLGFVNCSQLASIGAIQQDIKKLTSNCPAACGTCKAETCVDVLDNCFAMTAAGDCLTHPTMMGALCKRSCGICNAYDPCSRKGEGDSCVLCPVADTTCMESTEEKTCQSGQCVPHAFPTPSPTAFRWHLGTKGSNFCPAGSSHITDESVCEFAAASYGGLLYISYGGSFINYPKGCAFVGDHFGFNRHPVGAGHSVYVPVCEKLSTLAVVAPTPPPTPSPPTLAQPTPSPSTTASPTPKNPAPSGSGGNMTTTTAGFDLIGVSDRTNPFTLTVFAAQIAMVWLSIVAA